jgi:hypothetical protein
MNFHIHGGDPDHIVRAIKEVASEVADHIHREMRERMERSAVV